MTTTEDQQDAAVEATPASVKAAFGAKNRLRLIDTYFRENGGDGIKAAEAWMHIYRLLLWIDRTTGLAHCYESDKSQPGKRWYGRSLAFHDWVSAELAASPARLAEHIDWLFIRAAKDLAAEVMRKASKVAAVAEKQRGAYEGRGFPKPGEDPELVSLIREEAGSYLAAEPDSEVWSRLVPRVRQYLSLDNKRKNLVGEGFEDVIEQVVKRVCSDSGVEVNARKILHEIPGFNRVRRGEKANKVDVAIVRPGMRTMVTAKWSVRADREKQFTTDYNDYLNAESDNKPFEYVFITNEFDPARLMRACEKLEGNALMFKHVVHINTAALVATYGHIESNEEQGSTIQSVMSFIESGRLISLEQWLKGLQGM